MASFFEGRASIMERSTLHAATGNEGEEIDAAIDASEEMAHMLEALQAAKAGASVMDASEEEKEEKREEEDIVGEQESRLSATIPPPPPPTTDAAAVEDSNTNTDAVESSGKKEAETTQNDTLVAKAKEKEEQPASATVDATKTNSDSAAAAAANSAADATSSANKKKKRTEAEMYDAFERLYMHHTVASLAHRIDFDVSMLDNRKEFRAPRRHSISGPREVSGSEWAASPLPTRPKAPASAKHSTTSSNNKRPPRPFSNRNSQKNKQSIARMIAATKPAAAGRETASAHSASTAEMENTSQKKSPELSKKSFKKNSLTVETKSDVVPTGDLVGAMSTDTEDDMLQDILNPGGGGLAEPGTFGLGDDQEGEVVFDATGDEDDDDDDAKSGDDVDTSQDLAAQEAAMVQALEQAVQEFETAAAVSDNKEPTERGDEDVSDLLDVAAKNVASAAEET